MPDNKKEELLCKTVKKISNQKLMIAIPDDIGGWWGLVAEDVMNMLRGKDITEIVIPISSFGGDVFEAFQIYNILKSHPATVSVYLYSKCMSAATIVACAADRVYSVPQMVYMVHKALCGNFGNAEELGKTIQLLNISDDMIAGTLAKKSGMTKQEVIDLMAVESYFTAEQALQLGFVDEIVETIPFDFELPNNDEFVKVETQSGYDSDLSWLWDSIKTKNPVFNKPSIKVFNSADISKFKKNTEGGIPTQNSNQKSMNFLEKIWNKIKGFIPEDKHAEAQAAFDSQNQTAINEMLLEVSNKAIEQLSKSFVKTENAFVLNAKALTDFLATAKPEEKEALRNAMGIETPKPFDIDNSDEYKKIQNELNDIKGKIAGMVGGNAAPQNQGNGSPSIGNGGGKELSNEGQTQKAFYVKMLAKGSIDQAKYDELVSKLH